MWFVNLGNYTICHFIVCLFFTIASPSFFYCLFICKSFHFLIEILVFFLISIFLTIIHSLILHHHLLPFLFFRFSYYFFIISHLHLSAATLSWFPHDRNACAWSFSSCIPAKCVIAVGVRVGVCTYVRVCAFGCQKEWMKVHISHALSFSLLGFYST